MEAVAVNVPERTLTYRGGVAGPEAQGAPQLLEGRFGQLDILQNALFEVAIEDEETGLFESGAGGEELIEDVLAGALFFEHFAEAANLALDAGEAVLQAFIGFGGHHSTC